MSHACHLLSKCCKTLMFCSLLTTSTISCFCHAKRHLSLQKWSEPLVFFNILTSKCASRHNGVHFFDIAPSKSGPTLVCFVHFDFKMCFAPQRRALFRHLNCQKWSDYGVFCTFLLGNVIRAETACTFSTSQLPKVVRTWCVLYILTWKCASRHNGVQFFISHLASWLGTRRFSEPTFRPSGAPNHWKNTVFRDYPTFSRICIFFLLTLLSSNLSLLSASSLLCFSSVHIVGSLTSKLPSISGYCWRHNHSYECYIPACETCYTFKSHFWRAPPSGEFHCSHPPYTHLLGKLQQFTNLNKVIFGMIPLQCEAPKIAKLVYNSNNYGLWYL